MPCEFMTNLGPNPTDEKIEKTLLAAVLKAQQEALQSFKKRVTTEFYRYSGNIPDIVVDNIFYLHTREIMNSLNTLFDGDDEINTRIASATTNPLLIGLGPDEQLGGFFQSGFIFAIYWYGITGRVISDPSLCITINNTHSSLIDQYMEDGVKDALSLEHGASHEQPQQKSPEKSIWNSSWPYWIAMLVIGLIIGTIISATR